MKTIAVNRGVVTNLLVEKIQSGQINDRTFGQILELTFGAGHPGLSFGAASNAGGVVKKSSYWYRKQKELRDKRTATAKKKVGTKKRA